MKTYFSIIGAAAFLSLCILQQGRAQQSIAYIRFAESNNCVDHDFQVNSITVLKNGKETAIPINKNGFDTLYIDGDKHNSYPTIFRLKNGEHYDLKCSKEQFDLFPVKGRVNGMIRFAKKNYEDILTVRAYYWKILDTLKNNETHAYWKKTGNYLNEIIFAQLPKIPGPNKRGIPVGVINLIFLHGEKYTVEYDGQTKKLNTTLDK